MKIATLHYVMKLRIDGRGLNQLLILLVTLSYISSSCAYANATVVLNDLLSNYDNRIRPGDEGPPTKVRIGMYIESLGPIRESTMDFSVTMYFRMMWQDPRLRYQSNVTFLVLKNTDMDKLWMPDLFFLYEKSSHRHVVTQANRLLWVHPDGSTLLSTRISVTVSCNMELRDFPMDSQSCTLHILSYAYSIKDIILTIRDSDVEPLPNLTVSKFDIYNITSGNLHLTYAIGVYSCAYVKFKFRRQMQSYVLVAYVPSLLLVVLAWVSFWIDAHAAPARVTLGVTTVLTATTLTASMQESLPTDTHAKAIDVWLVTCLIFVFTALLEYALANYLIVLQQAKMIKQMSLDTSKKQYIPNNHNGGGMHRPVTFAELQALFWIRSNDIYRTPVQQLAPDQNVYTKWNADSLDRVARIMFPLAFIAFNAVYWPLYILT